MEKTQNPKMNQDQTAQYVKTSMIPTMQTTIDFEITPEYMDQLIEKNGDFYESIDSFDFNIFDFAATVGRSL